MSKEIIRALLFAGIALCSAGALAAELAPTGVLRATYNSLNSSDARFDRRTQTIVGPVAAITKELSKRLNVPFEMAGVEGVPAVIEAVKKNRADIGFVPCDPSMAKEVDFSQAYVLVRGTGQCIIVARDGRTKLDMVNRFIDETRASGKLGDVVPR